MGCAEHLNPSGSTGFYPVTSEFAANFPAWLGAFTLLSKAAEHGGLWRDRARIEIVSALLGSSPAGGAANARPLDLGGKS
jgi:hypothetical protein